MNYSRVIKKNEQRLVRILCVEPLERMYRSTYRDDKIVCESRRGQEAMQLIDTAKTQGDVFVAFCTKLTEQLQCCFDFSSNTCSLTCLPDQLWSQFGVIRTSISFRASWHELCQREQSDLVSNIAFKLVITRCIQLMIKELTSQSACMCTDCIP